MKTKEEIKQIIELLGDGKIVQGLAPSEWIQIDLERTRQRNREAVLGLVGVVVLGGALLGGGWYLGRENRVRFAGFSEECVQQAEQQGFSPVLCEDNCFRNTYFRQQQYYRINDLSLAYRMSVYKCKIGE